MGELPDFQTLDRAFRGRDADFDGVFFAAVTSTGIFCRPSCPARKPNPENVLFFSSASEALFAGFRPCARCRPLASNSDPEWVGRLIARVEADTGKRISESELRDEGLDPSTVRRRFQSRFGLSFHAYQRARRLAAAFESIKQGTKIDDAVFDNGYESHSGFRDAFVRLFGEPPGSAASRSDADFIRIAWIESPIGPLVAGATNQGICLLEFTERRMLETQAKTIKTRLGLPALPASHPHIETLRSQLGEYFHGSRKTFDLPLHSPGTPFQMKVWDRLRTIPCGETWSYARLAKECGDPQAVRAVANANGKNRIAILIPCHRVIGSDGGLGGYGGGIWRKRRLLEIEGSFRNQSGIS